MAYQLASAVRAASAEAIFPQPDPFLARLSSIGAVTPDQAHIISAMQGPPRHLPARSQFGRTIDGRRSITVIREGWAFAYMLLANGGRQVIGFLLPGDSFRTNCPADSDDEPGFETITDVVVTEISEASARRVSRQSLDFAVLLLGLQSKMVGGLVEQLVDLGRRDSRARVAQFLLKLERRLAPIGLAEVDGYDCPISQYLIADALGLTAIHVNRVLRALREEGVVTLRKDRVTIHDRRRLMAIAGENGADGGNVVRMNGSGRARIARQERAPTRSKPASAPP